jgi:short subunit dehydrogenase-like uncharacterized protein
MCAYPTRNPDFDIVLWGSTGATGRRVAHHLASRCASEGDLRWALAGRNQAKIESVRAKLGATAADVPIIIGDSHDAASLDALVARTKVVCSTVGPYAKYGSELLGACVRAGTHYCDLAAEAHWIRKMIDAHQAEAEQTGARIVHACGVDSIPSDIGVFFLQREAKERHEEPCSHIKMRVAEMKGGFSGGTAASMIYGFEEGPKDPTITRYMTEPYCLNPEGQREGPDAPDTMMSAAVKYDEDLQAWTKPFFMGPMNTKIVRRSNALLGYPYGKDFRYEEASLVGTGPMGWVRAKGEALRFIAFILTVAMPPTRSLLKKYVLPKSGEGPSREKRETGFWRVVLIGKLSDGNVMRARVEGAGDPGVESTSRMLVEAALCLAQDTDRIAVGGGSWTPASALGELLLARLTSNAGLTFALD